MTIPLPAADGAPFRTVLPLPASPMVQGRVAFGAVVTVDEDVLERRALRRSGADAPRTLLRLPVRDADPARLSRRLQDLTRTGRAAVALVPTDAALPAVLAEPPTTPVYVELPFELLATDDPTLPLLQAVQSWTSPTTVLGFGLTMPTSLRPLSDRQWLILVIQADLRRPLHYVYWPARNEIERVTAFASATEAMLLHGVSPDELPFDRSGRLGSARDIRSVITRPIIAVAPYDLETAPVRWLERTPGIGTTAAARLLSYRDAHRPLTDDVLRAVGVDLQRAEPWMTRPDLVPRRLALRGRVE